MQYLEDKNRFYVPDPDSGDDIAEMTFTRLANDRASIDHTYVNTNYRGKGIADHLFELVVKKLRQEGREIIPICSYAVKKFEKTPIVQNNR